MANAFRTGLLTGILIVGLSLLTLLPCGLACLIEPLTWLLYVLAGWWAMWSSHQRPDPGTAVITGGLAAFVAAVIGGLADTALLVLLQLVELPGPGPLATFMHLPPDLLLELDRIFPPGPENAALVGTLCCVGNLVIAAVLGAVGGLLRVYLRPIRE